MARGLGTDHERLEAVSLARTINQVHGYGVISAMEVDQLDAVWIDVFLGVTNELPKKRERQKKIQAAFDKFEREHPTYGQRFRQ